MAKMIPAKPRTITPSSLEDIMFDALANLPDDYYVFHSLRIITVDQGVFNESETDFVIFNPQKGIISLEAKAGQVYYENGDWYYGSGILMSHDGPFSQASGNKWKLKSLFEKGPCKELVRKCKFLHAVWFPSLSEQDVKRAVFPTEASKRITLCKEALFAPLDYISSIFDIELPIGIETNLTDAESKRIVTEVLCPAFDILPAMSLDRDLKSHIFHRMLEEQKGLLNYLEAQQTAVIQGVAGTGKTLIAVEKARRHAEKGERVLFLCYNQRLRQHLHEGNDNANIEYYTIDGLACRLCNTAVANYSKLRAKLEEYYLEESFPYDHVIIDEGQDFGQDNIEENAIISLLESIIVDREERSGTFYIFYDQLQLVQGNKVPTYISNADCRLTLYKNCRNTENIATTSMKPLKEKKPRLFGGSIKGKVPKIYFLKQGEALRQQVDLVIGEYRASGIADITILTCGTEQSSMLAEFVQNGFYNNSVPFTTCRKFKGLEADAIILVDVGHDELCGDGTRLFYVGASRARFYLSIMTTMTDEECKNTLFALSGKTSSRRIEKALAAELNAIAAKSIVY